MSETAGVVIDAYKLPIFKKHLDAAGLTYTVQDGMPKGMILLRVKCKSAIGIKSIIEAAHREAQRGRMH